MTGGKKILDSSAMDRALTRMAHQVLERNRGTGELALIGIRTGGVPLAQRLRQRIGAIEGVMPPMGVLDITLYRDDWSRLSQRPVVRKTEIPFSVDDITVILVDDVLYTGRTVRAALDALSDFGRPRRVQLAVLVDRGCRELPIQADYVGISLNTSNDQHVDVHLKEVEGVDEVIFRQGEA